MMPNPRKNYYTRAGLFQYAVFVLVLLVGIGQRKNASRILKLDHLIRENIDKPPSTFPALMYWNKSSYYSPSSSIQRNQHVHINVSNTALPHQQLTSNVDHHEQTPPTLTATTSLSTPMTQTTPPPLASTLSPTTIQAMASPSTQPVTNFPTVSPSASPVTSSPSASPTASHTSAPSKPPASNRNQNTVDPNRPLPLEPPPRFFLGIFTSLEGKRRREVLRQALKMYNDTRVCPFGAFDRQVPPKLVTFDDDCQLIYTFVVSANPNGPIEITRQDRNVPMLAIPSAEFRTEADEYNDMTFLRIREQPSNQGKTTTWLNYASQVAKTYHWDYVVKCDAKTHLHIDAFFNLNNIDNNVDSFDQPWPRGARNLYSGFVHWSYPDFHILMNGAFYILSQDLAESVSKLSMKERQGLAGNKKRKDIGAEDVDTGFAIMMNHEIVHVVALSNQQAEILWKYPLGTWEDTEQYAKFEAGRLFTGSSNSSSASMITSQTRR